MILDRAVDSFVAKRDLYVKGESVVQFVERLKIPRTTFNRALQRRTATVQLPAKRRGRPLRLSEERQDFIIDAVAAMDEVNQAANRKKIVDMVIDALGADGHDAKVRAQAGAIWNQTIHPRGRKLGKLTKSRLRWTSWSDLRSRS